MITVIKNIYRLIPKGILSFIALIMGYLLHSFINIWQKEREWKGKYRLELQKEQLEKLREFLGEPMKAYYLIINSGELISREEKYNSAKVINEWILKYYTLYPNNIKKVLNRIDAVSAMSSSSNKVEIEYIAEAHELQKQLEEYLYKLKSDLIE